MKTADEIAKFQNARGGVIDRTIDRGAGDVVATYDEIKALLQQQLSSHREMIAKLLSAMRVQPKIGVAIWDVGGEAAQQVGGVAYTGRFQKKFLLQDRFMVVVTNGSAVPIDVFAQGSVGDSGSLPLITVGSGRWRSFPVPSEFRFITLSPQLPPSGNWVGITGLATVWSVDQLMPFADGAY